MDNKFEIIATQDRPIRALDLASFLEGLSKANHLAHIFLREQKTWHHVGNDIVPLARAFERFLHGMDPMDLSREMLRLRRDKISDIEFQAITTNSPIKFIGYCTGISILALSLSIALAGGEADLKSQTFKVHSLVDAAARLYNATR